MFRAGRRRRSRSRRSCSCCLSEGRLGDFVGHGPHFQIIDPDFGGAGPGVDVEQQGIHVGVGEIKRPLELGLHELLLLLGKRDRASKLEALPAPGITVGIPADDRCETILQIVRVALVGKHHARQELYPWTVGLQPQRGTGLVADGNAPGWILVVDVISWLGLQADVLGTLAVVPDLIGDDVERLVEGSVEGAFDPARLGCFKGIAVNLLALGRRQSDPPNEQKAEERFPPHAQACHGFGPFG